VLTVYIRSPDRLSPQISKTVLEISQISGKSLTTLVNAVSLLKLNLAIQAAIAEPSLLVFQGYLFASHLDSPDPMKSI
jgi:hypothetical protein